MLGTVEGAIVALTNMYTIKEKHVTKYKNTWFVIAIVYFFHLRASYVCAIRSTMKKLIKL